MTTQNSILKAKQARIDAANKFEQEQIIEENLFVSTYTEKLFKLAYEFRMNVRSTNRFDPVEISTDGFIFDLETYLGPDFFIPHTPIGDLSDLRNRFETIQDKINSVIESERLEEEKQQKIEVAKNKINNVLTEEERKLLGM